MRYPLQYRDLWVAGDPRPVEMLSGCCSTVWGAWVGLFPGEPFVRVNLLVDLAFLPREVWGAVFLGLGLWRLFALGRGFLPGREVACMGAFLVWTFVGVLGIQANPVSPNGSIYVLLALANAWVYCRLAHVLHA